MDAEQEEYFNTSDEEDTVPTTGELIPKSANGDAPLLLLKPLVDYPDDDVMDVAGDETAKKDSVETPKEAASTSVTAITHTQQSTPSSTVSPVTSPSSTPKSEGLLSSTPTPERLAEKRRREEEDDDELGRLSRSKKKNPTGGVFGQGAILNRKRSFGGSGSPPSKKIAINLAVKTTATASAGEGEGGKKA